MMPATWRSRLSLPVILAIIALSLSALYAIGLIVDWPAWVHGSNWVWVRRVPTPGGRFLLMPLLFAAGLVLAVVALRPDNPDRSATADRPETGLVWSRRRTAPFLTLLVILTPLFQLAIAAQHRSQPLSLAVTSQPAFWRVGMRIEDPLAFARAHTAKMPTYDDVHLRTQPPGWPLAYWATYRVMARLPIAADLLGRWFHRYDCAAPEFQGYTPPQLAAAGLRVAIVLLSGLGVLPLYALGRRFYSPSAARLTAVGYAFTPALLVFSGRFDVAYALLGLAASWLGVRYLCDGRRFALVLLAVSLAVGSFFSFTVLPITAFVFSILAAHVWMGREGRRSRLGRLAVAGGTVLIALLAFWGFLYLAAGVNGWQMFHVGQAIHREYRLNYPTWFLFNLYDLAVFMGIVPFVGAVGASGIAVASAAGRWGRRRFDAVALGWVLSVLLLNLSAAVRAETGRLWLFLMPLGGLVGFAWWVERWGERPRPDRGRGRRWIIILFAAYLVQALVTGYLLGGRGISPATQPPVWSMPASAQPLDYRLGDAIALRGYELAEAGETLNLTLYWRAIRFPRVEYSVFVHLLDENGVIVGQSDGPPGGGAPPVWCWAPGEVVADRRTLNLAPLNGRPYRIGVGLYEPLTGSRLPVRPPAADDRVLLPPAGE